MSMLQRIATVPHDQFLKIDRLPPSEYTMVYIYIRGNHFALTVSSAEDVVNHGFGVAVVTMPYIVSVSTAIDMLVVSRTLLLSSYYP